MKIRPLTLQVELLIPEGSTKFDVVQYIINAVGSMKGEKDPDDPLRNLDMNYFEVREVYEAPGDPPRRMLRIVKERGNQS